MKVPPYPKSVYIGITDKCNAYCQICWRRSYDGEFLDIDFSLLRKISNALRHADVIGWWGDGELFASADIANILSMMKYLNRPSHTFSTNGKSLAKYAKKLARINIKEIQISLDGGTTETLERIRTGVRLSDIVKGIDALKKEFALVSRPLPTLIFDFVSMCSNIYELPLVVRLAKALGVSIVRVSPLNPHHSHLATESLLLVTPGTEKHFYELALREANLLGVKLEHSNPKTMEVSTYVSTNMYPSVEELLGQARRDRKSVLLQSS